jgi:hypothetical protein
MDNLLDHQCCDDFAARWFNSCARSFADLLIFLLGMIIHLEGMALGALPMVGRLAIGLLRMVVHLQGMALCALPMMIDAAITALGMAGSDLRLNLGL